MFRHLMAWLKTPDESQGFIVPAVLRALSIRREFKPDVMITTSPPFSVHVAGLLVAMLIDTCWLADFRDPFVDGTVKRWRTRGTDRFDKWLEKTVVRKANGILTGTESLARRLAVHRPNGRDRFFLIRNGVEEQPANDLSAPSLEKEPVRFGYFGSLYLARDPRPLLDAFQIAVARQKPHPRFELHFWGRCDWYYGKNVEEEVRKRGLEHVVFVHGTVARNEAKRRMREMHVLVLLAQEQPLQVPHKLYEYLEARRPIFALCDAAGETTSILSEIGGHVVLDSREPEKVAQALADAAAIASSGEGSTNAKYLRLLSRELQLKTLTDALERLCASSAGQSGTSARWRSR
jgi:hypothetical protein